MKWAVVRRKLARVDRALDKAIEGAQIPGAVILAQMPKAGELMEFETVRGMLDEPATAIWLRGNEELIGWAKEERYERTH